MSNNKPYTINVEVPTPPLNSKEPRTVSEILVTGVLDIINSAVGALLDPTQETNTEVIDVDSINLLEEGTTQDNLGDNEELVVYQDNESE